MQGLEWCCRLAFSSFAGILFVSLRDGEKRRIQGEKRSEKTEPEGEMEDLTKRQALEEALEESKMEACEDMRDVVRAAFLTHPAATEADFERCWPALRDEMFKQHALRVYNTRKSEKES